MSTTYQENGKINVLGTLRVVFNWSGGGDNYFYFELKQKQYRYLTTVYNFLQFQKKNFKGFWITTFEKSL